MRKLALLFVFIILNVSCESAIKIEKPKNLISQDEMTAVLTEMFVVNSAKGVNRKLLELKGVSPETYILEKHSIDSTQFAESNNYYSHNLESYSKIIEAVKQNIVAERSIYEAEKKKEDALTKAKRDSITASRKKNKLVSPIKLKEKKDIDAEVIEN